MLHLIATAETVLGYLKAFTAAAEQMLKPTCFAIMLGCAQWSALCFVVRHRVHYVICSTECIMLRIVK